MPDDSGRNPFDRRRFLKLVGCGAAAASGCLPHVDGEWNSCLDSELEEVPAPASRRVVEVRSPDAVIMDPFGFDAAVIQQMFVAGLLALTDQADEMEAWKLVMPGRQDGERIALKVNALNPGVPSRPEALAAITQSLVSGHQVPSGDVFVWDRTIRELERAGITTAKLGIECRGTFHSPDDETGPGYETEPACLSGQEIFLSRILTTETDHLINVSVLKNHSASGFTGCLKNHYGSFSNPWDFHDGSEKHIARLNTLPQISSVTRLHIMDALVGVCLGDTDKPPDCVPGRLLLSFDPVAIDQRGLEIRDEMRAAQDPKPDPVQGAPAGYIAEAEALGLGTTEYELVPIDV